MITLLRFTPDEIAGALRDTGGNVTRAALVLGCNRDTVRRYLLRFPELKEARRQARIRYYITRHAEKRASHG